MYEKMVILDSVSNPSEQSASVPCYDDETNVVHRNHSRNKYNLYSPLLRIENPSNLTKALISNFDFNSELESMKDECFTTLAILENLGQSMTKAEKNAVLFTNPYLKTAGMGLLAKEMVQTEEKVMP
tara:strand:+ start:1388 stop:1768 length:381 start_codon:yes stop_codon:yes gene_type:complete